MQGNVCKHCWLYDRKYVYTLLVISYARKHVYMLLVTGNEIYVRISGYTQGNMHTRCWLFARLQGYMHGNKLRFCKEHNLILHNYERKLDNKHFRCLTSPWSMLTLLSKSRISRYDIYTVNCNSLLGILSLCTQDVTLAFGKRSLILSTSIYSKWKPIWIFQIVCSWDISLQAGFTVLNQLRGRNNRLFLKTGHWKKYLDLKEWT
jgi:hypothetical protein